MASKSLMTLKPSEQFSKETDCFKANNVYFVIIVPGISNVKDIYFLTVLEYLFDLKKLD